MGDVILDEGHHQSTGAEAANRFTAKPSPVAWALTWVAQLKSPLSVTLHVDCLSTSFIADGRWATMKECKLYTVV